MLTNTSFVIITAISFLLLYRCTNCSSGTYIPPQCQENTPCAWLLAPDYNSTSFVVDHINHLNLYVKVAWLGRNLNDFVNTMKSSFNKRETQNSILILTWYPSEIVTDVAKFLKVTFKLCDDVFGCEYEIRRIVKISWEKLPHLASPIHQMLQRITFTKEDYEMMIDLYNQSPNKDYEDLGCEWIKESRDKWMYWAQGNYTDRIYIGGIFPYTPNTGNAIEKGARMAMDAINNNNSILPYYKLSLHNFNGNCSVDTVLQSFINSIKFEHFNNLVGVLGPPCTETVEPLVAISKLYRNVIISYSAEGADYSDREKYPYFFRTIGENIQYKNVYLALFKQLGWKRIAGFTKDGQKYTEYIAHLETLLAENNITFIANAKFPEDRDQSLIPRVSK